MPKFIAIYGTMMVLCAIVAGIVAAVKRRDLSFWATVAFLFPPLLIVLFLMPKNTGPRPRRAGLDEEEQREYRRDGHDRLL